jgi:hypothetical protein
MANFFLTILPPFQAAREDSPNTFEYHGVNVIFHGLAGPEGSQLGK